MRLPLMVPSLLTEAALASLPLTGLALLKVLVVQVVLRPKLQELLLAAPLELLLPLAKNCAVLLRCHHKPRPSPSTVLPLAPRSPAN